MKKNTINQPIGIFDSGLGGLTVLKELKKQMPQEKFIYFGDTAHVPYGNKSPETIKKYCKEITNFLLTKNIKLIIVACNTASSTALKTIKKNAKTTPVIDVISASLQTIKTLRNIKKIGIIGTETTINSKSYYKQIKKENPKIEIISQACPLFVPIIEEGLFNHAIADKAAKMYLKKINNKQINALILGCTHYPIIKKTIKKNISNNICLIDSAIETAHYVKKYLKNKNKQNTLKHTFDDEYFVSDKILKFNKTANIFLNKRNINVKQIKI